MSCSTTLPAGLLFRLPAPEGDIALEEHYSYPQAQGGRPRNRRSDRHRRPDVNAGQPVRRAAYQPDDVPEPSTLPPPGRYPGRMAPTSYDYDRYAPGTFQPQDAYYDDIVPRRWPWLALILVLLLAVSTAGLYFFVPANADGALGMARSAVVTAVDGVRSLVGLKEPDPPRIIKFETPSGESLIGVKTVFTFTADSAIDGVRITDEVGNVLNGAVQCINPPDNTVWTLSIVFDKAVVSTLRAEVLRSEQWYASDKTIAMTVLEPTPAPTQVAAFVPEATATPVPVMAFIPEATAEPEATPEPEQPATDTPPLQAVEDVPAVIVIGQAPEAPDAATESPFVIIASSPETNPPAIFVPPEPVVTESPEATEETPAPVGQAPEPPAVAKPVVVQPDSTPMPLHPVSAHADADPAKLSFKDDVYRQGKKVKELARDVALDMPAPGEYVRYDGGVFTFRGNCFRSNAAFGVANVSVPRLSVLWKSEIGSLRTDSGTVYGVGWTGQPAIVKWAKEIREMMNISADKINVKALKEVIFAAQDGKVYFLDLMDGLPTRDPIDIGYPLKGSVAVDTLGRPMIAFGQGISKMPGGKIGDIGLYIYSLIDQSKLHFLNGRRSDKQRQYSTNGAFDGTPLFDRNSDSMIIAGENGLLYTLKLHSEFDFQDKKTISIDPEVTHLQSKGKQNDNTVSIESSVAMYGKYVYMADKYGYLRCVDTDTMTTVWAVDCGDNTDAAIALGFDEDGSLGLYTGNTAMERLRKKQPITLRRLDALTGEEIWAYSDIKCTYDRQERSGLKASPIVGEKSIGHLVIFTLNMTANGGATMVALDKKTGAEVWRHELAAKTISSPVAVYNEAGDAWVIQGDESGKLTMLNALTGAFATEHDIGGKIEGSPAVYNDILVIGTSSKNNSFMYGVRIE